MVIHICVCVCVCFSNKCLNQYKTPESFSVLDRSKVKKLIISNSNADFIKCLLGCGITWNSHVTVTQNYTDILENSLSVSYKAKTMLLYHPAFSILWYLHKRNGEIHPLKEL